VFPGLYYFVQFRFGIFRWGVVALVVFCAGMALMVLIIVNVVHEMRSGEELAA
jgi:ABC-type nickel/cobalt efflux system permease component RcnA